MNISISSDNPFGDEPAFQDFLGQHQIAHDTINRFLAGSGKLVSAVPLADTPIGNNDWLLDHYQLHLEIGIAIGQSVPDLASVDLTKEDQYLDWMQIHSYLHQQINSFLGITT